MVSVHNRKATQKDTVYISELVPPDRMSVMHNYCQGAGIVLKILKHNKDGTLDLSSVQDAAGSCGVYVEQPNPLGILDGGLTQIKEIIGDNTALIVGVQPVSLGLWRLREIMGQTLLLEKDNHSAVRRQVVAPFTEFSRVANHISV